jgi:type 1 glutamine amidotransferase
MRRLLLMSALLALAACHSGRSGGATAIVVADGSTDAVAEASADQAAAAPFSVLLFSRTLGFRHDSIPAAIQALTELQNSGGFAVEATEDPTQFNADNLARFRVVVFLLTTGDVLDDDQQAAFEAWIGAGGGYLGVHSAADTEYSWPFYGALMGAYFKAHPAVQVANVDIEVADHPAMAGLTSPWKRTDEWYDFQTNPRGAVTVLATVDESSYTGGTMGPDHPIVWAHATSGGGRALYTAMGHSQASYAEPAFRQHLTGALRWVAGVE